MSDRILRRISAARTTLILDHPFFGALALKLQPVDDAATAQGTMATDGRSLFYAPEYVSALPDVELVGLLAHEVMHPAMQHHTRRDGRDAKLWNVACDYAINPLLVESGFTLPQGGLIDPAYKGMSAEQIFSQLQQQPKGDGQGDSSQPGQVLDAPEPAQDGADWQVAVKQAVNAAKMMGRLPASLAREIADQTAPKVDWRALLRRFVQECASADYSWKLPNRRYLASGLYLPALRSESLPPIVVAVDTSGSIGAVELAAFEAEVRAIVDECQPEATHVIYCDAKVNHVDVFERGEPIELHPHGGGGTDFRPVFDHVEQEGLTPSCLIYLTDGEGRYPHAPASFPTLWALTSKQVAPWGESVEIHS